MRKEYDTLVLIGRFQPVHNAHVEIIRRAALQAKQVIIIVGSANQPRTYKNPWTSAERRMMLSNVVNDIVTDESHVSVRIEENIDTIYNDQAWAARVQAIVAKHTQPGDKIGIIGHKKDDTSFYLSMFPQWGFSEVELIQPLNATNIRDLYFRTNANMNFLNNVLPGPVYRMLDGWKGTPDYLQVIEERDFLIKHDLPYASLPYGKPIFVTADAVVICAGHVLMIQRRAVPGKGLWALPGGYVDAFVDRSVKAAAIRELREEAGIKVPVPVLIGSIEDERVFDAIDRSARGRIITHAFKIVLPPGELPKTKKQESEVMQVKWWPIGELDSRIIFEDHYEIIQWAVGG